ncbi:MAG: glycosyl hydrolase family 95 catalytic domain-containing protein [Pyrinomonadaceae bacterium]
MNYWPTEVCNLSELHAPLFDLVKNARVDGRNFAKNLYEARGFVILVTSPTCSRFILTIRSRCAARRS